MPDLPSNTEGHRYNEIPKGASVNAVRQLRMDGREKRRTTAGQANNTAERTRQALEELQAAQEAIEQQQEQLEQTVASIPITRVSSAARSGLSMTGSWATVASTTISRPEGKNNVAVTAAAVLNAQCDVPDISQFPIGRARVIINGAGGAEMPLLTGAYSNTRFTLAGSAQHSRVASGAGDVVVEVQVRADNIPNGASWQGTAQINAQAVFTP